jgi:hypothetical protein
MKRFVVVVDTPGIKKFVFGTDALAEVRGGSALLDRLNRFGMEDCWRKASVGNVRTVFANGGTGQFIVTAADRADIEAAVNRLAAFYHQETGGEVHILAGLAEWPEGTDYRQAVQTAYEHLQWQRALGAGRSAVTTFPLVLECSSLSHLPAAGVYRWGEEQLLLSEACQLKRKESRQARRGILWSGWMEYLDSAGECRDSRRGFLDHADALRCETTEEIGDYAAGRRRGYIGLIYADGNAMGRLVQELDSPEVYTAFSELVDGSIRDACYEALRDVCAAEIEAASAALDRGEKPDRLPADILLLGGDDLLVLLPADRALKFALQVTRTFERLTRERQAELPEAARRFFAERQLADRGLTISCGVAVGPARYPFYLLLELAEELLSSAKRGGSEDPTKTLYWTPSYVDFHILAGSASQELSTIRKEDYQVYRESVHPRTLRPYRGDQLERLYQAAERLRQAQIPKSKLHALFEAALEPRWLLAQTRVRELFGRLRQDHRHPERRSLWEALRQLGPIDLFSFPWLNNGPRAATPLADLVEVHDLLDTRETREAEEA